MDMQVCQIKEYMERFPIKHSCNGYRYLTKGIKLCLETPGAANSMAALYKALAEIFETTPSGVERGIRYAILNLDINTKEFIARAVDDIDYESTVRNNGEKIGLSAESNVPDVKKYLSAERLT